MSDQINVNRLSNALQQKVDLPSGINQGDVDYVVESQLPTAENNYTWYRLYKSGWVEQGLYVSYNGTQNAWVNNVSSKTLPIPMADTNYIFNLPNCIQINDNGCAIQLNRYTTSCSFNCYNCNIAGFLEVKGFAAQS